MKSEESLGKQLTVVNTVFMYKVNVALAVMVVFLALQNLFSVLFYPDTTPGAIALSVFFLVLALLYGMLAINGFVTKIIIFENGIVRKSLLSEITIKDEQIKKVSFLRKDMNKMRITIFLHGGKQLVINTQKYAGAAALVDALQKYKLEDT